MLFFYLWGMVNFGYYKIFKSFLDFSPGQVSELNLALVSMLKDFYFLIPLRVYILTAIVFGASVIASAFYNKFSKEKIENFFFNDRRLLLISKKRRTVLQVSLIVLVFLVLNGFALLATSYFYKNPKLLWWDSNQQLTDLGLWGHFYDQIYNKFKKDEPKRNEEPEPGDALQNSKNIFAEITRLSGGTSNGLTVPQLAKLPNIVVIQLETTGSWALNNTPTPMPFLQSLIKENIGTTEMHGNSCETINAEYSALCSFLPLSNEPVSYSLKENNYNCLPQILRDKYNYNTNFYHSDVPGFWSRDTLLPRWGFDNLYLTPYFRQKLDDGKVLDSAFADLKKADKPFFGFISTFTAHSPHNEELIKYQKENNGITVESFAGKLNQELKSVEIKETELRNYFGFLRVEDDAIKTFFQKLKVSGLDKNTIVVLYGDHRFYNFKNFDEQIQLKNFLLYNQLPFVVVLPEKQTKRITNIISQIDIAPTLLSLVEGDLYQPRSQFLGQSLFTGASNFAINKCLGKVYFINDKMVLEGNAKTDQYAVSSELVSLSELEKQSWLNLLSGFVRESDKALKDNLVK